MNISKGSDSQRTSKRPFCEASFSCEVLVTVRVPNLSYHIDIKVDNMVSEL